MEQNISVLHTCHLCCNIYLAPHMNNCMIIHSQKYGQTRCNLSADNSQKLASSIFHSDRPLCSCYLAVRGQAFTSNKSTMSDEDHLPTLSQYQNKNDLNRIRTTTAELQFLQQTLHAINTSYLNDMICNII